MKDETDRLDAGSRQNEILDLLRMQERVGVEELAEHFDVTRQTIRADLRELGDRGLLARIHGGAVRVETASNREYGERRKRRAREKEAMGQLASSLIPDNCSVSLNIGTTTEQVARSLARHTGLTVLSNNINVINNLMNTKSKELILVGGTVRQSDGAIVGSDAVEFISRFKVDFAVIGCSALDEDGAVLDYDAREVSVAREFLQNSRRRILVCDSSKFNQSAPIRICGIADLDYVITDASPPTAFTKAAAYGGTEILALEDLHHWKR